MVGHYQITRFPDHQIPRSPNPQITKAPDHQIRDSAFMHQGSPLSRSPSSIPRAGRAWSSCARRPSNEAVDRAPNGRAAIPKRKGHLVKGVALFEISPDIRISRPFAGEELVSSHCPGQRPDWIAPPSSPPWSGSAAWRRHCPALRAGSRANPEAQAIAHRPRPA